MTMREAVRSPVSWALGLQLGLFADGDVAQDGAVDGDGFGHDLAANRGIFTNDEDAVGDDLALDLAVADEFVVKFDGSFDFDVGGQDVLAGSAATGGREGFRRRAGRDFIEIHENWCGLAGLKLNSQIIFGVGGVKAFFRGRLLRLPGSAGGRE